MSETEGQLIDELLTSYVELKEKIAEDTDRLHDLLEKANQLVDNDETEIGTLWLEGEKLKAKIVRRVNVRYTDKKKLAELFANNEKVLGDLFNIELRESGQKVEKFLVSHDDSAESIAEALMEIREKSAGKPGITVQANV